MTPITPIRKIAVLGALWIAACAAPLSAGLLVKETFDYPDGDLHGNNGGTGFIGSWSVGTNGTGTVTVASGSAVLGGVRGTWASRNLDPVTNPTFYFSYRISSNAATAPDAHSLLDALVFKAGGSIAFQTGLHYDQYGLRLRAAVAGANTSLSPTASTSVGTTYTVMGKFSFDDGAGNAVLSIWINPTGGEASPVAYTKSWQTSLAGISQIIIQRYDDYQVGTGTSTTFDDIRIGTDWASVSSIPKPAP